jgi:hypothetical protein
MYQRPEVERTENDAGPLNGLFCRAIGRTE